MDIQTQVLVFSLAGSAFFTMFGFAAARLRSPKLKELGTGADAAAPHDIAGRSESDSPVAMALAEAGREQKQLKDEIQRLKDAASKISSASSEEARRLERDLKQAQTKTAQNTRTIESLRRRLADAETQLETAVQSAQELATLRDDATRNASRVAELLATERAQKSSAESDKGLLLKLQALEAKAQTADDLRDRLAERETQLQQLEGATVSQKDLELVRQRERALLLKEHSLQARIKELEEVAREHAALKQQSALQESELRRLPDLMEQLRMLEAQLFAAGGSPAETGSLPWTPTLETSPSPKDALSIDGLLGELLSDSVKVAVLADASGLIVGGSGDPAHQEEIAAVTGMLEEISHRARALVPLGQVTNVRVADVQGVAVATRLFHVGDDVLGLTTYGANDPLQASKLATVIPRLLAVLQNGGPGSGVPKVTADVIANMGSEAGSAV
ncbi:MAG: hypothetical protein H6729_01805 [Deltaproteobacteria bacterium]|nr:hypothetical protein [Deltaproteobacteria bacterium]